MPTSTTRVHAPPANTLTHTYVAPSTTSKPYTPPVAPRTYSQTISCPAAATITVIGSGSGSVTTSIRGPARRAAGCRSVCPGRLVSTRCRRPTAAEVRTCPGGRRRGAGKRPGRASDRGGVFRLRRRHRRSPERGRPRVAERVGGGLVATSPRTDPVSDRRPVDRRPAQGAIHVPRRPVTRCACRSERCRGCARDGGDRCEFTGFVGRCRRRGGHADHWIPWSRGGASVRRNLVWACPRHNLRRGTPARSDRDRADQSPQTPLLPARRRDARANDGSERRDERRRAGPSHGVGT